MMGSRPASAFMGKEGACVHARTAPLASRLAIASGCVKRMTAVRANSFLETRDSSSLTPATAGLRSCFSVDDTLAAREDSWKRDSASGCGRTGVEWRQYHRG